MRDVMVALFVLGVYFWLSSVTLAIVLVFRHFRGKR